MHSERQERLELPTLRPQWLLRVLLAPGALPHTAPGRVRIGIQRLWPNVLALLESWAFDLGSQVGCRAAGVGVHTTYTLAVSGKDATVAIEGPVPDWTIPAGHRTEDGSTMGAVQCSTLAPPFCSCTGGCSAELLMLELRRARLRPARSATTHRLARTLRRCLPGPPWHSSCSFHTLVLLAAQQRTDPPPHPRTSHCSRVSRTLSKGTRGGASR